MNASVPTPNATPPRHSTPSSAREALQQMQASRRWSAAFVAHLRQQFQTEGKGQRERSTEFSRYLNSATPSQIANTFRQAGLQRFHATPTADGPLPFDYVDARETLGINQDASHSIHRALRRLHRVGLVRTLPESPGPIETCPHCNRLWAGWVERCSHCGAGSLERVRQYQHEDLACGMPTRVRDQGINSAPPALCPECKNPGGQWHLKSKFTHCLSCETVNPRPPPGSAEH